MRYFQHLYNVGGVQDVALSGLADLQLVTQGGQQFLQTSGAEAGQVFTWNVTGNRPALVHNDVLQTPAGLSAPVTMETDQGSDLVWVYGIAGQGAGAYSLGANGRLELEHRVGANTGVVTDMAGGTVAGQTVVLTTTRGGDSADVWRQQGVSNFVHVEEHRLSERGGDLHVEMATVGGQALVIATSLYDNTVSSFTLTPNGGLALVGAADGLGISQPTHLEMLEVRGNDDGLSLFAVLPEGRLLHLETVADALTTGMDDPGSLTLRAQNGAIEMFVAESGTGDLGAWRIDVSNNLILEADAGGSNLQGGQGRDTLSGGDGADVFILHADGGQNDRILDFELGVDRIDLSGFEGLWDGEPQFSGPQRRGWPAAGRGEHRHQFCGRDRAGGGGFQPSGFHFQ